MTGTETPLFHPNFPPRLPASLVAGAGCKKLGVPSLRRPLFPQEPTPVLWAGTLQRYGRCRTDGHVPTEGRGAGLILRLFIGISLGSPRAPRPRRLVPGSPVGTAGVLLCRDPRNPRNPPLFMSLEPPGHRPPRVPLAPKRIEIKPAPKPQEGGGVAAVAVPPPQRVLSKAPGCKSEGTSAPLAPLGALLGGRRVDERN